MFKNSLKLDQSNLWVLITTFYDLISYFLVDFLVVDMKMTNKLSQAPIILGRPFLENAKVTID